MAMTLYVSSASPYSIKIWALMRFLELEPKIVFESVVNRFAVIQRRAGQTMVPLLLHEANGEVQAQQDSTRIAEFLATKSPRSFLPADPGAAALAWLIEDYADEWMVRWFASARWQGEDAVACSKRVGHEMFWELPWIGGVMGTFIGTQISATLKRTGLISDSPALMRSRDRLLQILETLFEKTPFVFGFEPTIADFAMYGMLWQFRSDLTGAQIVRDFPNINRFLDRVDSWRTTPVVLEEGKARPLHELEPLIAEIRDTYLALLRENLIARSASVRQATILTPGGDFEFRVSRYLVERLREVLGRFSHVYQTRDHLFLDDGKTIEDSLRKFVESLNASEAGRDLLKELHFPKT